MIAGAGFSAIGAILLIFVGTVSQILLFGSLMAIGSAAFSAGNWALIADLAPPAESARFFGLANIGTAGAAAVAGLFGLLVDGVNQVVPGAGYPSLFLVSAIVFIGSAFVLEQTNGTFFGQVGGRVAPHALAGRIETTTFQEALICRDLSVSIYPVSSADQLRKNNAIRPTDYLVEVRDERRRKARNQTSACAHAARLAFVSVSAISPVA